MREALEDAELDMLEGLDIGSCQWQAGAELDAAGAVCLNAMPALVRDVRDARDAAEQAVAARAVSLDANHVLIIYAGEEGPIRVADQLQELATRASAASRRADEAQRQLATVVAERDAMAGRLEQLAAHARMEHDDTNRGCGKAWGYDGPCTCGADEHNAKVEALLHA